MHATSEHSTITAEMMDAAEAFARDFSIDETDERFILFEYIRQLSARELEIYTEKKRQQFERAEPHTERWRTIGSLITAGYTQLARYGER